MTQSALEQADAVADQLRERELALLLDYDGTLTPIVRRPEDAVLTSEMRTLLEELAARCTVAVVSGRDRKDAEQMVGIDSLIFAGSHGYDIRGPHFDLEHAEARQALPDLDAAERELRTALEEIAGARVERKRFAIAIHYREVEDEREAARIERLVDEAQSRHGSLRKMGGKKIFELQPDVPWDKGRAILWLLEVLKLDHDGVVAIYIGDDVTDEFAFRALRSRPSSFGIRVGGDEAPTDARYHLQDCAEVEQFLGRLLASLPAENA